MDDETKRLERTAPGVIWERTGYRKARVVVQDYGDGQITVAMWTASKGIETQAFDLNEEARAVAFAQKWMQQTEERLAAMAPQSAYGVPMAFRPGFMTRRYSARQLVKLTKTAASRMGLKVVPVKPRNGRAG